MRTTFASLWCGGAVMADDAGRLAPLLRWCGMALVAGGVLMVVATLLHPSRETATTIIASEAGLIAEADLIDKAVQTGEPVVFQARSIGTQRDGTQVAEFHIDWSFKRT